MERRRQRGASIGFLVLVMCALAAPPIEAQESSNTLATVNLPYLHYFGFGAFKSGEQEAWVLRGSWTPELLSPVGRPVGWATRLTGSAMGVRGRSIEDELETIGMVGLTAGIELRMLLAEYSLIRTYTDWGIVLDVEHDSRAGLGILGMLGEFIWPWRNLELGVQPSLDLSGSATSTRGLDDSLLALQVRLDARRYLGFHIASRRAQLGLYTDFARFWGDTGLGGVGAETAIADTQFEVGTTFGTHEKFRILGFGILLSAGFRWGEDFRGIRIGLGDRVTRLPPRP